MRIVFACDHAGFEMKEYLQSVVKSMGHDIEDMGAYEMDEDDDYTDYISKAAEIVSSDPDNVKAIVLGGSGQGEAIVANRYKNVRAVVYYGEPKVDDAFGLDIIKLSRKHNDANVLSLGARFISNEEARRAVTKWLETSFSGEERHERRIKKIELLNK